MTLLRWVIRFVAALAALVVLVFVGARLHDGPLGPIPGGALASGALVAAPVADWSFATDVAEIELQLASQSKSRTVWIIVHGGKAYVPAATEYPPGKSWHRAALEDGRATLRISGKRYPVTLTKIDDAAVVAAVRDVAFKKYPARPGGEVWLFAITSRPPDAGR